MKGFPDHYDLLLREAAFASRSLGVGLTELRRYDFANKGAFFHASVSIAIGLERLLKLIVILAHRSENNGTYPTNEQLKHHFGHKLPLLIARVREITKRLGIAAQWDVLDEDLSTRIIVLLSDFAVSARYYNLDVLTGKAVADDEPLGRWEKEVGSEIIKRHPRPMFNPANFEEFCAKMDQGASFRHVADGGSPIRNAKAYFTACEQIVPKQKYSVFYTYRIIRVLSEILHEVEMKCIPTTFLYEFFSIFRVPDDAWVLKKKIWTE